MWCKQGSSVASEDACWTIWSGARCDLDTLWRPELHKVIIESNGPWQIKSHRHQIPLHSRHGVEGSSEAPIHIQRWVDNKYSHQPFIQSQFWILYGQAWSDGECLPSLSGSVGVLAATGKHSPQRIMSWTNVSLLARTMSNRITKR